MLLSYILNVYQCANLLTYMDYLRVSLQIMHLGTSKPLSEQIVWHPTQILNAEETAPVCCAFVICTVLLDAIVSILLNPLQFFSRNCRILGHESFWTSLGLLVSTLLQQFLQLMSWYHRTCLFNLQVTNRVFEVHFIRVRLLRLNFLFLRCSGFWRTTILVLLVL